MNLKTKDEVAARWPLVVSVPDIFRNITDKFADLSID